MVTIRKFGRKISLPSVVQIKHQILLSWLADQTAIEAREATALGSAATGEQKPDSKK